MSRKVSFAKSKYDPRNRLEELRNTKEKLGQDSRYPGQDSIRYLSKTSLEFYHKSKQLRLN
jgi:hypothetical protein